MLKSGRVYIVASLVQYKNLTLTATPTCKQGSDSRHADLRHEYFKYCINKKATLL